MWPCFEKEMNDAEFQRGVDELKAFRDIGETLNYLGITCVVVAHWEYWSGVGCVPRLICDYVDGSRRIRQVKFGLRELPVLIKQQEG